MGFQYLGLPAGRLLLDSKAHGQIQPNTRTSRPRRHRRVPPLYIQTVALGSGVL